MKFSKIIPIYGEIPGFQGVWASTDLLDACRTELQSALEDWIILGLRMGHELPVVAGINIARGVGKIVAAPAINEV